MQQGIACTNQTIQPRLLQPHLGEEHLRFLILKLADLFLDPGRDDHMGIALGCGHVGHFRRQGIAGAGIRFGHVADVEHGFRGQKLQHPPGLRILGIDLHGAGGFARLQRRQRLAQQHVLLHRVLVAAFQLAHQTGQALLDAFHIGQHQLHLDGFGIGHGVHAAFDMGDVVILETAQHMGDGVAFADIGQELIAQPLALGRALHQPRDVHKGHARGDDLLAACNLGQPVEPVIGHRHLAHVRLDRAEGKIGGLRGGRSGQRVEQC